MVGPLRGRTTSSSRVRDSAKSSESPLRADAFGVSALKGDSLDLAKSRTRLKVRLFFVRYIFILVNRVAENMFVTCFVIEWISSRQMTRNFMGEKTANMRPATCDSA